MLTLQPVDWDEAVEFISQFHRHHKPPQGWKFGIAVRRRTLQSLSVFLSQSHTEY